MNLYKAIADLYVEKKRLDYVIAALEDLERNPVEPSETHPSGRRRGRKSMSAEERLRVSARMKRYWQFQHQDRKPD